MTNPDIAQLRASMQVLDEDTAAEVLGISPKTMKNYRRLGIGPRYTIVARKIQYQPQWLRDWLEAGGTRAAGVPVPGDR